MDEQNKKEITTIPELAKMINNGFQTNQEYMDAMKKELKEEIKKVDKKLDGFIESFDEAKLETRVEYIENVLNLPKK